ncbi:MAG TPA: peroxidase, partial [Thiothrix sp.]|nr:peroxidase [Thiothrix sp.]
LLKLIIQILIRLIAQLQGNNNPDTPKDDYRSFDGSKNNANSTGMGAASSEYLDIIPTDTTRDIGGTTEANLANPRAISNEVMAQTENTENKKGLSDMFWLWGQFLDHDITLGPDKKGDHANIAIPIGDRFFDPQATGTQTMGFERTEGTTNEAGEKTYKNAITSYIDGSNIYGSSKDTADKLRSFEGGKLISSNNLLPENDKGHFLSGDVRVNENLGLTSMHTLWMREHNQIAEKLGDENPQWNDEKLFQETRKEVIAEMQAITFNEFLPQMLGNDTIESYKGYDSNVTSQISNSFATAAYRIGHTMISPNIHRLQENGEVVVGGNLPLRNAFFQPQKLKETGIDPILRGFASHTAQAVDPMLIDDLRNFLFGPPGAGGFDLASLNIQRGRDHQLASFNDSREALGLERITSFNDPIWKGDFGQKLAKVYNNPDEVDLWVGGLAEKESGDSLVGDTFTLIMKDQFERVRDGDRFWYQNQFSDSKIDELNTLKLSDIIKRNTDIENIQEDVMVARPIETQASTAGATTTVNENVLTEAPTIIKESATNSSIRTLDSEN